MNNKPTFLQNACLFAMLCCTNIAYSLPLNLASSPLFLTNAEKANVLVILDNSNSMDEAANGSAVGGANPNSKSEIARSAINNLITNYEGKINMGLMAYQQDANASRHLHNSPYDASFDPANYDPTFVGSRDSTTKRFRVPNVSNPGTFVYYNIALPFYSTGNAGNSYCYSTTANFDNGSETFPSGPWDNYRCFRSKTSTSDTVPIFNNSASETASGFISNNGINGGFSPTDSDLAQNLLDFGTFLTWDWVSPTWFANTSPGRGFLHVPIRDLENLTTVSNGMTQVAGIKAKLGTSQFVSNGPTNPALPLQNAGLTPLEGTLLTANDYFTGTTLPADEGGPAQAIPESCGKDFIALLTDGLPSTNAAGTVVTDSAAALSDVAAAANTLVSNGIETYMIGFALPVGTDPSALDTIAVAGNTNTAYMADDPTTLQAAFDTIFNDILAKTGASSSAATNSASLSTNSFIYQARFNSGDWSGQLLAKSISLAGVINSTNTWDAAVELDTKSSTSRTILTYGRDTNDGIPFRWSDIDGLTDTTAKDALNANHLGVPDGLGSDRVDFLRGGTGGTSSGLFRSDRAGKLGDIIHSTPSYVGVPNAGYNDANMPGYAAFRTSKLTRTPIIYSGANDGMLHGFKASDGEEILAYIPRTVFSNLSKLTAIGYGTSIPHEYYVDGSPIIADAFINSSWATVLAGGLRAGGQGIYALDITTPNFTEASAATTVLWEFSDEDDADLGYTFTQPTHNFRTGQSAQIAKMANGKWAVIIGNGYNNTDADGHVSSDGHAYLYILFIEDGTDGIWTLGTDYIKIDTSVGSTTNPNGLATPTPVDVDGDHIIDYIYAGDLYGNLWKFDVTNSSTSSWGITISGNQPLFTAIDSSSNPQPITSAPLFTWHPDEGYMISFGTGKYMELTDTSTTDQQTIYGLWDQNTPINNNRSTLVEQTVIDTLVINGDSYRVNSNNSVDYASKDGWFMDLPESGERVDVNPIGRDGRFVFATRTPSSTACAAGGNSWLMEFNYLTGGRLDVSPFDVNGDGVINYADFQTVTLSDGSTAQVPVSGYRADGSGMIATPTVIATENNNREFKVQTDTTGKVSSVLESVASSLSGRISWKEILQ
jgi:type IV pilus assembly protein PilY1